MELGRLSQLHPQLSERRLCRLLGLNRSTSWRKKTGKSSAVVDLAKVRQEKDLEERIHALVLKHPSWGYRRIWAWLRVRDKLSINKKKVHRLLKENGWQVRSIVRTPRPRVSSSVSATSSPHQRWAIDATSLWTKSGWVGVMAVIDCCTRKLLSRVWYRDSASLVVNGRRARRLVFEDDAGERATDLLIIELDGRRVMMILCESPTGFEDAWRPWFSESLSTLEVWDDTRRRTLLDAPGR